MKGARPRTGRAGARRSGRAGGAARRAPGVAREPFPLILCAPTATGKTTLARELAHRRRDVAFSVSVTTRPQRPGERDGVDYHFTTGPEFDRLRRRGELLEWARVHEWKYGTPVENLRQAQQDGKHLILDIDVQGARQVKKAVGSAVSVFLLPPSFERLLERLEARGSEGEGERRSRLGTALSELEAADEFDYVVVNDRLEDAISSVEAILGVERQRTRRHREDVIRRKRALLEAVRAYLGAGNDR